MPRLRERSGPARRTSALLRALARRRLSPGARATVQPLLAQPVDWPAVLAGARREGLSGLLRRHAVDPELAPHVPPVVREELDSVYYASAARTTRLLADTRRLCASLAASHIPVIVLKGAFLGSAIYGNIGLRPCQDIDLLVPRSAVGEVHRACLDLGYASERDPVLDPSRLEQSPYRNSLMYRREEAGHSLFLHLHWHLVNASYPLDVYARFIDLDAIWSEARPWSLDGVPVKVLSPAHFLLHLAEHALKHCYEKLILLTDMAETMEGMAGALAEAMRDPVDCRGAARPTTEPWGAARPSAPSGPRSGHVEGRRVGDMSEWMGRDLDAGPRAFWSGVRAESVRFGLDRPLAYALRFAEDLIGAVVPAEAAALRGLGPVWGTERWFARAVRADVRRGGVNWLAYLALMDSWGQRARFLFRAIFPPPEILARLDAIASEVGPSHYWGRARQAWTRSRDMANALWAAR